MLGGRAPDGCDCALEVEVSPAAVLVGVGVDPESVRLVSGQQGVGASGRWSGWRERPDDPVAVAEANAGLGVTLDGVAAFVHDAMVLPAQQHEVREARLAAMGPVLTVMGL